MIFNYFDKPLELGLLNTGVGFAERFLCVLALVFAVLSAMTIHEFAHAYVALKCGDPTAKNFGRVTLNPVKHIHPAGFLMLLLVGFGWAKPVPVNPLRFKSRVRDEIFVSLAGIVTNLVAAFFSVAAAGLMLLLIQSNVAFFEVNKYWHLLAYLVLAFFWFFTTINICVALFNIIPVFPLDGFHVLENLLAAENGVVYFLRRYGMYILLGLILLGYFWWSPLDWYIGGGLNLIYRAFSKFWGIFGL